MEKTQKGRETHESNVEEVTPLCQEVEDDNPPLIQTSDEMYAYTTFIVSK